MWRQEPGKLAVDGAVAVQGNEMWFASAREGYLGVNMFTAELVNDHWSNWKYSGDRLMKEIQSGEILIQGDSLNFSSGRTGGPGSFDIWVTSWNGNLWSDPVNIKAVKSNEMDRWPFISSYENELWFTRMSQRTPAIFGYQRIADPGMYLN